MSSTIIYDNKRDTTIIGSELIANGTVLKKIATKRVADARDIVNVNAAAELGALTQLQEYRWFPHIIFVKVRPFEAQIVMDCYSCDLLNFYNYKSFSNRMKYFDQLVDDMLNALHCLSLHNILHGDVKSGNILVEVSEFKDVTFRLADFGHSERLSPTTNSIRVDKDRMLYTNLWRAPELLCPNPTVTCKADLWALAITLLNYIIGDFSTKILTDMPLVLLREIYKLSKLPLPSDTSVNLSNIDVGIDVKDIVSQYLTEGQLNEITGTVDLLTGFLKLDPTKRTALENFTFETRKGSTADAPKILRQIHLDSELSNEDYVDMVLAIVNVADENDLCSTTAFRAIDILERYICRYPVLLVDKILVTNACICLGIIVGESIIYGIHEYDKMFIGKETIDQLSICMVQIWKGLDYILVDPSTIDLSEWYRPNNMHTFDIRETYEGIRHGKRKLDSVQCTKIIR